VALARFVSHFLIPGGPMTPTGRQRQITTLREGIYYRDASWREMISISGNHGQIIDQRGSCDLLVERVLGMRHPQLSPDLGCLLIEGQDGISEIGGNAI
jgi:hypothetical protein